MHWSIFGLLCFYDTSYFRLAGEKNIQNTPLSVYFIQIYLFESVDIFKGYFSKRVFISISAALTV